MFDKTLEALINRNLNKRIKMKTSFIINQIDSVVKYIMNQEKHHKKKTFGQEYLELLQRFNIEYDERYILKDIGE